jgi:hypothetical protein
MAYPRKREHAGDRRLHLAGDAWNRSSEKVHEAAVFGRTLDAVMLNAVDYADAYKPRE